MDNPMGMRSRQASKDICSDVKRGYDWKMPLSCKPRLEGTALCILKDHEQIIVRRRDVSDFNDIPMPEATLQVSLA
jgi:hypothetical protein